jgi:putative hydrolase of the HAD superfamily
VEEKMIRNIIFDLFGVIARFDTEGYYTAHGISPSDQQILQREVFRSLEFAMGDRGTISEEEAVDAICARVPEHLHEAVCDFIYRQNRTILPIPGMEALLQCLKDHGRYLFLLSNTSKAFHRIRTRIPGIELFNGTPINAETAQYVGMKAYVFNGDVAELGKWLIEK